MQLAIFNGSPRKSKSNSTILTNQFLNGYHDNTNHNHCIHYLASTAKSDEQVEAFLAADTAIIIFPLYTDAMPAQVMYFIEQIVKQKTEGKNVGFIVQSGFPEAHHSIFIEKYLEKLSKRKRWNYLGTVIKGGIEGIQVMPHSMTRKLYKNFELLGRDFAKTNKFNSTIVEKLKKPYRYNATTQFFFRIFNGLGLNDFYWNKKLKENNAFEKRFDKPYAH